MQTGNDKLIDSLFDLKSHLDERFDQYNIGAIAIVVDVIADGNPLVIYCSDPRLWLRVALLREALDQSEAANEARLESLVDDE